jgi:hypothetical protein
VPVWGVVWGWGSDAGLSLTPNQTKPNPNRSQTKPNSPKQINQSDEDCAVTTRGRTKPALLKQSNPIPNHLSNPNKQNSDEDYAVTTRGRVSDRLRVALAGSAAVRAALGEGSNFTIADARRAHRLAERMVFFYGGGAGGGLFVECLGWWLFGGEGRAGVLLQ